MFRGKRGQSAIEYAMLIALVVAACMAMLEYGKRAVNENIMAIDLQTYRDNGE